MKNGAIIGVVIVILVVLGFLIFFIANKNTEPSIQNKNAETNLPAKVNEETGNMMEKEGAAENIVEVTSSGFSPKTLEINAGDTVRFVNKDSSKHWPASDFHPTHRLYPGFDALRGLAQGEEYSFKFDKKGSWTYHDHLNPGTKGTIIVN